MRYDSRGQDVSVLLGGDYEERKVKFVSYECFALRVEVDKLDMQKQ